MVGITQFDSVDFVTDSKVTTDVFNSSQIDVTECGHVITTCRYLFSSHFTNYMVKFSRRLANVAARINI